MNIGSSSTGNSICMKEIDEKKRKIWCCVCVAYYAIILTSSTTQKMHPHPIYDQVIVYYPTIATE